VAAGVRIPVGSPKPLKSLQGSVLWPAGIVACRPSKNPSKNTNADNADRKRPAALCPQLNSQPNRLRACSSPSPQPVLTKVPLSLPVGSCPSLCPAVTPWLQPQRVRGYWPGHATPSISRLWLGYFFRGAILHGALLPARSGCQVNRQTNLLPGNPIQRRPSGFPLARTLLPAQPTAGPFPGRIRPSIHPPPLTEPARMDAPAARRTLSAWRRSPSLPAATAAALRQWTCTRTTSPPIRLTGTDRDPHRVESSFRLPIRRQLIAP
jgi:hypothetical protein